MVTKEDWRAEQVRLSTQPLDLENLVKKGILEKKGAWYRILKFKAIPEHAWAQVCEIAQGSRGNGSMIKFAKLSKRARTDLEKVVGTRPKS
jgi:hypothetical protein